MNRAEFLEQVGKVEGLEVTEERGECFIVKNHERQEAYRICKQELERNQWNSLQEVLAGRNPQVLDGITRIVGYFSKVSNWNKSKKGELVDRHHGDYAVQ